MRTDSILQFLFLTVIGLSPSVSFSPNDDAASVIFVSVENCGVTVRRTTIHQPCSIFDQPSNLTASCEHTVSTLILPPYESNNQPPQVLLLSRMMFSSSQFVYNFTFINIPYPEFTNFTVSATGLIDKETTYNIFYGAAFLAGVLYDHMSRHIYIITRRNAENLRCEVYLLNNNYSVSYLYYFDLHSSFRGVRRWSTNPYRQMFYYQKETKHGQLTELHAIPYSDLIFSLKNGEEGVILSRYEATNTTVQVVGNWAHIVTARNVTFFYSLVEKPIVTECLGARVSPQFSLFVVSGWEYCKLRDGPSANRTVCEAERIKSIIDLQVKWFHVFIATAILFILALVLVLLCVRCRIIRTRGIRHQYNLSRFQIPEKDDNDEFLDNTL